MSRLMERPTLTSTTGRIRALPFPLGTPLLDRLSLSGLRPAVRHSVWGTLLFGMLAVSVLIRLDVQSLHRDLDKNVRAQREALVLNEHLRLELDARQRLQVLEVMATQRGLTPQIESVRLREPR